MNEQEPSTDREDDREDWTLDNRPGQENWGRPAQRIASVLWPSFIAAVVGILGVFSFIDPELLGDALMPAREFNALHGYGMLFFFLWFIALLSSATTVFLRGTRRRRSGMTDNGK
jgi:hypothetical protein